jgi:hypothetical protein
MTKMMMSVSVNEEAVLCVVVVVCLSKYENLCLFIESFVVEFTSAKQERSSDVRRTPIRSTIN